MTQQYSFKDHACIALATDCLFVCARSTRTLRLSRWRLQSRPASPTSARSACRPATSPTPATPPPSSAGAASRRTDPSRIFFRYSSRYLTKTTFECWTASYINQMFTANPILPIRVTYIKYMEHFKR